MRVCTSITPWLGALLVVGFVSPVFAQDGETEEAPAATGEETAPEVTEAPATNDSDATPKTPDANETAPSTGTEQPLGPGGKPLRTDYPGTEESKQARMDTNQIKGMNVDPNEPSTAYQLRITELETKIDDLKEKVFHSKTRIALLRENLLSGTLTGARLKVIHRNDIGSSFRLKQVAYSLDGERVYSKVDKDGDLTDKETIEIVSRDVTPGSHKVTYLIPYQGKTVAGVFSYFQGYDGKLKGGCEVDVQQGKITQLTISAVQEGGVGKSIEQRPTVKCESNTFDYTKDLAGDEEPAQKEK